MPLIRSNDAEMVYSRAAGARWFSGIASPFILALFTSLPLMLWPHLPWSAGHSPLELAQPVALLVFVQTFGIGIFLTGLYGAGPEDLILDLKSRTYRFRRGFPLLARWKTGPFSDFEGVALRKQTNKNSTFYRVALTWRDEKRTFWSTMPQTLKEMIRDVTLNSTRSQAEAVQEMHTLVKRLDIPEAPGNAGVRDPEQIRQRSIRMLLLGGILCALFLSIMSAPELLLQWQLDVQGRTTRGIVIDHRYGSKHSYLNFTYQVDGRTLRGKDEVTYTSYRNVDIGGAVDVTYLPQYPKTCRTNYSDARRSSFLFLAVYGAWLVIGCLASLFRLRRKPVG